VGFRTPSGYLKTLQSFKTMDLPRQVRGKPGAWDPAVCLSWGARVFDLLRTECDKARDADDERIVWRVSFKPGVGLSMCRLDEERVEDVRAGEDRVGFLPRSYWERVRRASPPENANASESLLPAAPSAEDAKTDVKVAVESRTGDKPESAGVGLEPRTQFQGWQL
jgi:hypothetical protein